MVDVFAPVSIAGMPAGATYAELHNAFAGWSRSDVGGLLADLSARLRSGRYPAGRPYRHVNGFTKIVLAEHPAARLTLHFWPAAPGTADDVSRPHDHRFAFSSILLGGHQHFVELAESAEPAAGRWHCYEYRPYLRGRLATVRSRGSAGLLPLRTVERTPFVGHYRTSSTIVHQAVTRRDHPCVTLVLRGPRERRTSKVYYRPGEPAPRGGLQFGRHLDHDDVVRQVDYALALVTGP